MSQLTVLTFFCALLARRLHPPAARERRVPSFTPDGSRDRWYSVAACLHLESLSWATLTRNRRGVILALHFRDEYGGHPLLATMQPGQRYSFFEQVGDSMHSWSHKELETGAADFQRCALDVAA